jgi:myo-inositol-1(or 4)-monophosphatase
MDRIDRCLKTCSRKTAPVLRAAAEAALKAGKTIKSYYGRTFTVQRKGEIDLVTEADLASEKEILAALRQNFPKAAYLAEESSASEVILPNEPTWIIDPLDGTTNFAHGFPWFSVSIAYAEEGEVLSGVIYAPMLDELFFTCKGCGTFANGLPVAVSKATTLQSSLLATGFPYAIKEQCDGVMAALAAVLPHAQGVRRAGSAALDLAYVACGRLDGFWEIMLKPWDTAAGSLMVQEAGGIVSDFAGRIFTPGMAEISASNGAIHEALLEKLDTS